MRLTPGLLGELVAAVDMVGKLERPADKQLSAFFRLRPKLGQGDRGLIAETVYAGLRRRRLLEHLGATRSTRDLALATLARLRGFSLRELEGVANAAEVRWLAGLKEAARQEVPFAVACDLPDWLIDRLRSFLSDAELLALAQAMQQPAALDLRVNILKTDRDAVLPELAAAGIDATPTPYSPIGIRVRGRPAINRHPLFLGGSIEVQDEASQLVCQLLAPRRGEMVADFCAGAGGKSLTLGAAMRSTGRVYAFDVSARRLAELKPRLARSGLSNVHPQAIASERDPKLKRLAGKFARVLVDAPCSGLGTLRRNPDLKWRQTVRDVEELTRKQASILAAAAKLVRPGGRLVYATCSILPEENDAIVREFLTARPEFRLQPARIELAASRIELPQSGDLDDPLLRLYPHVHGTDGFFAALLERSALPERAE
ncbi:MAG: RsmB/NOP family class I SAM-dependent RNA methyltransferase [Betaproteobacteria bacterium]|jgi:16S rRNA (cytosine967-C5)-methyltransferase|nr:RsmB/NOP family class I SAM-dependent RNA methyltransferase [Betaproteobacteria bacterium]